MRKLKEKRKKMQKYESWVKQQQQQKSENLVLNTQNNKARIQHVRQSHFRIISDHKERMMKTMSEKNFRIEKAQEKREMQIRECKQPLVIHQLVVLQNKENKAILERRRQQENLEIMDKYEIIQRKVLFKQ